MAPTFAPELKIPVAKARSFFGKYSAVALIAAGKLPASPSASTQRQTTKAVTLTIEICATRSAPCARRNASAFSRPTHRSVTTPHTACSAAPSDQTAIDHAYPFFVPTRSTKRPANSIDTA